MAEAVKKGGPMTQKEDLEAEAYNRGCDDAENGEELFTSLTVTEQRTPNIRAAYRKGYNETLGRLTPGVESNRKELVRKDR